MDAYTRAGVVLLVFGAPFTAYSYWVLGDVTLTAVGLSSLILGATVLLVPSAPVPRESVRALVESGCLNVEAVLEEFDVKSNGYYLPPRDDRVYCYLPLREGFDDLGLVYVQEAPIRVINQVHGVPGLTVFPPGSEVVRLAGLEEEMGVEDALVYVLVDFMEAVEGIRAVRTGDRVVIELSRPRLGTDFSRYNECLGSLPVSTAGCVLSWVLDSPVLYTGENAGGDRVSASFRVVNSG